MITEEEVAGYLGLAVPEDPADADRIALHWATAAVNTLVPDTVPRVRPTATDPDPPWPDDVHAGALLMASRLFTRRRSPTGIATYDETGPAYVPRWDPDLERLLRIGKWAPPRAR